MENVNASAQAVPFAEHDNKEKSKKRGRVLLALCLSVGFFAIIASTFCNQIKQVKALDMKIEDMKLIEQELLVEENRINLLISHVGTDEYIADFSRENFGYTYPDEVLFMLN